MLAREIDRLNAEAAQIESRADQNARNRLPAFVTALMPAVTLSLISSRSDSAAAPMMCNGKPPR